MTESKKKPNSNTPAYIPKKDGYKDKWLMDFLQTESHSGFDGDPKTLSRKPKALLIFFLHSNLGWSIPKISDYTGVPTTTTHRWIHSDQFKEEKHMIAERIGSSLKDDLLIHLKRMHVEETSRIDECSPFQLSIMGRNAMEKMRGLSVDPDLTISVVHSKVNESTNKIIDVEKNISEAQSRIRELAVMADKEHEDNG